MNICAQNYHPILRNRTCISTKPLQFAIALQLRCIGFGKSTVCTIVKKICEVLAGILLPWYIFFLQNQQEEQDQIDFFFRDCTGFPQVVAALHGCHVPMIAPLQSLENYVNRKGFHAVTVQDWSTATVVLLTFLLYAQ